MKRTINKILALVMFAVLLVAMTGCAQKGEPLEISDMAGYEATAIVSIISDVDRVQAEELLEMEDDEIENSLAQIGFLVDGKAFKNGLDGWLSLADEFGDIAPIANPQITSDDEEITAAFEIQGSLRNGDCVIVMDKRNKITSITTSAHYTIGENMSKAGLNTVLGMGTTFVILIFLSLVIGLFKYLPGGIGQKEKEEKKTAPVDNAVSQIAEREALASEALDNGELIAVITAAIAAYEAATGGSSSSDGFVVRSIRRHY